MTLLNLNLPKIGGLEVLKAIRAEERTKHLPVVVLTSSNEEKDQLCVRMITLPTAMLKFVAYDQFAAAALQLGLYWMVLNAPPPRKEA